MHHTYRNEVQRRQWQNPEKILTEVGVKAGDVFIDLACGFGFFAIPAAEMIGSEGVVCGVDVDDVALEELRAQSAQAGLGNIRVKLAAAEDVSLCERCADIVFIGIASARFQRSLQGVAERQEHPQEGRQIDQSRLEKRIYAFWAAS